LEEARLGNMNPELEKPRRDVELYRQLKQEREEQLRAHPSATVHAGSADSDAANDDPRRLQARLNGLKAMEPQLVADIAEKSQEIQHISRYWEEITEVSDGLRKDQQRLNEISDNLHERELKRQVPGAIRTVDQATAPSRPDHDRRGLLSAAALLVAVGCG